MALTEDDFAQFRSEFETRFTSASIDWMSAATAIGAYGERFTAMDARFTAIDERFTAIDERFAAVDAQFVAVHARLDGLSADVERRFEHVERRLDRLDDRMEAIERKLDSRFGWQTFMMAVLGFLILFGDTIRPLLGLG